MKTEGASITSIGDETGISRPTIRKILSQERPPDGRKPRALPSKLDAHEAYVRERLTKYPNLSAIRLLDELKEKGYDGGYTILKQLVAGIKEKQVVRAVVRFETQPGGQGQVDWAEFGRLQLDGEETKLYLFTMVLGWSRMRYAEFTTDCSTPRLLQCLLSAFEYFGGFPRELLFDNMKQVVLRRGATSRDHEWNPLFADFVKHFGFVPRLCRPRRAQTKGKVENSVKFVRTGFFEGREFTSLQDMNHQGRQWLDRVNAQPHGTTHEPPRDRLPRENLTPLSNKPAYVLTLSYARKISRECYVSYLGNKYSVPWKYAARDCRIHLRDGKLTVDVAGVLVAEHALVPGAHQVVRVKEHFEGLLKAIREASPSQPRRLVVFPEAPQVQRRQLQEYEQVLETFSEATQ